MLRKIIPGVLILMLLVQCNETKKIIDWGQKEMEWRETIVVDETYYQAIVEVPKVEDKTENLINAESDVKMEFADQIQIDDGHGVLWKIINLEERKIESVKRARKKILAANIDNLELESTFVTDHSFFAAYKINKEVFEKRYSENRLSALDQAKIKWSEGKVFVEEREPQQAADAFCEAMIYIENYLGAELVVSMDGERVMLDQAIIESMRSLKETVSIQMDPMDTVVLNYNNDYIGIINFEVLQNETITGKINLSVDVASVRQEQLTVNGYSILVNDLPMRLSSPFVKLRSDLFRNLRLNGNEITQLIYQKFPSITAQVRIVREFKKVNVVSEDLGYWPNNATKLLKESLENADVTIVDEAKENTVNFKPTIKLSSEEGPGFHRLTAQWLITVNNQESPIKGVRLVSTDSSLKKAEDDLLYKLNEQMKRVILDDLLHLLSDSKNK